MTNVEEIFNLLETSYAIQQQSKAMTMYDLYYGKHKIQSKPDKVVGDEAFRTSKVMLNYYKLAVKFFVYLILSQPVKVTHPDEGFMQFLKQFHKFNQIDKHNAEILEASAVFGNAFEHIFFDDEGNLRVRLIDGMASVPFWDDYMDLEYFAEQYSEMDYNGMQHKIARIFTEDETAEYIDGIQTSMTPNLYGLPIVHYINDIFHRQVRTDLEDLQSIVEEMETLLSDVADTNKYHGDPLLLVFGQRLNNLQGKGKILNFEKGADAKYLTWDQNINASDWLYNKLKESFFDIAMLPRIFFDPKSMTSVSGVALKMFYMVSLVKAQEKALNFKDGLLRRYSVLAKIYELTTNRAINLDDLNIEITVNLPTNETETINNLLMMVTGGLMTKETALKKSPYIDNPDEELAKLIENSPDVYRLNEGESNGNATTD